MTTKQQWQAGLMAITMSISGLAATSAADASFAAFDRKAKAGGELNVVFFGGSLTWGSQATDPTHDSYRAKVAERLRKHYRAAYFDFWDAAIGGTGSQLGAFRLERDVLARQPDLVFYEYTVNDGCYSEPDPQRMASYEAGIRRLVQRGVPVVVMIFPVKPDVEPNNTRVRPLDPLHKKIAAYYNLPVGDAVTLAQQRVAAGQETPDTLWDVPGQGTHCGSRGYALYAEAGWDALLAAIDAKTIAKLPASMLYADTYMTVNRAHLLDLPGLPAGWTRHLPDRTGFCFDFTPSRWLDDVAAATNADGEHQPPALKFKVRGQNLILYGESTVKSGKYQVVIDGGAPKTYDAGNKVGSWRYVEYLAEGLAADKEHTVEIIPQLEKGQELHFESLCVAGAPATVE
jgi:lysophospholipase L1-like esterase